MNGVWWWVIRVKSTAQRRPNYAPREKRGIKSTGLSFAGHSQTIIMLYKDGDGEHTKNKIHSHVHLYNQFNASLSISIV